MRTENDLRAAFGALENHAPDATEVLVRTRAGLIRGRQRAIRLRIATGAGAGLAAAAVAITLVAAPPVSAPAATGLRAKLLAAFDSAAGQILTERFTAPEAMGGVTQTSWYYPWGAKPGQQVTTRELDEFHGKPDSDIGFSYLQPAPGAANACDSGIVEKVNGKTITQHQVAGTSTEVDYEHRTWEVASGCSDVAAWDPVVIRAEIASGDWTATGPVEFEGHRALELTGKFIAAPLQSHLWVDASTYLPLHGESTSGGTTVETDFALLPATGPNLAQLKPPVPAGFTRTYLSVPPSPSPSRT